MIKAVFFDVDGSLLSHKTKQVSYCTRKSLEKLRDMGIKIFLSTGRYPDELARLPVNDLTFDGYVSLNGQLCLDRHKKVLLSVPFNPAVTQRLAGIFCERKIPLAFVEQDRIYINLVNDAVRRAQREISTPVPPIEEYRNAPVYQAAVFFQEQEEAVLKEKLPDGCKFTRWSPYGLDIIPSGGGKLQGILYFQKLLHIAREEICAFGDAENDIDMLEYAGIGVAMGNAPEKVKAAADFVTKDVDSDGIPKALSHFQILSFPYVK